MDNLTVEIDALKLSYKALGKFKTRWMGPWTPPMVHMEIEHLKVVSVDQHGNKATPNQVWAHNQLGMQEFFMYKKISGEIFIRVRDVTTGQTANLIRKLKFENQATIKRQLQNGAVLGVQANLTIPSVNIDIEPKDIPIIVLWAAAMQYCFAKDQSFDNPL